MAADSSATSRALGAASVVLRLLALSSVCVVEVELCCVVVVTRTSDLDDKCKQGTASANPLADGKTPDSAQRSCDVIWWRNRSASRLSTRAPSISACGYMKNGSGRPIEPGNRTS